MRGRLPVCTAWDQDLHIQISADSWNAICEKALRASRSIKYKLRTSTKNFMSCITWVMPERIGAIPLGLCQ